jgi:yecA family protein
MRDSLAAAGVVVALAELHGGVCGALCVGDAAAASRWLVDVFDDEQNAAPAELAGDLEELVNTSVKMLDDDALEFKPLLPSDDAPLAEQVEALAAFCQGFLNGIGTAASATAREAAGRETIAEILRDFAEIGRAGLSDEEAAGEAQADFALAEIQEYVRVSVQIVFEELAALRAAPAPDIH